MKALDLEDTYHATEMRQKLKDLYRTKTFCDLHLHSSDGKLFRTHKLILGLYSKFFRKFLYRNKGKPPSETDSVNLDCNAEILTAILEYIYKGRVEIRSAAKKTLVEAAKKLKVDDLVNFLENVEWQWRRQETGPDQSEGEKETSSRSRRSRSDVRSTSDARSTSDIRKVKDARKVKAAEMATNKKRGRPYKESTKERESASNDAFASGDIYIDVPEDGDNDDEVHEDLCLDDNVSLETESLSSNVTSENYEVLDIKTELREELHTHFLSYLNSEQTVLLEAGTANSDLGSTLEVIQNVHLSGLESSSTHDIKPALVRLKQEGDSNSCSDLSSIAEGNNDGDALPTVTTKLKEKSIPEDVTCTERTSGNLVNDFEPRRKSARLEMLNCLKISAEEAKKSEEAKKRRRCTSYSTLTMFRKVYRKYYSYLCRSSVLQFANKVQSAPCDETDSENPNTLFDPVKYMSGKCLYSCPLCKHKFRLQSVFRSHLCGHFKQKSLLKPQAANLKPHKLKEQGKSNSRRSSGSKRRKRSSNVRRRSGTKRGLKRKRNAKNTNPLSLKLSESKKCDFCERVLSSRDSLKYHLLHTHRLKKEEIDEMKSFCTECETVGCNFTAKTVMEVERHVKEMHPEVQHNCMFCNRGFFLKKVLVRHMCLHHLNDGKTSKHVCSVCGKKFIKDRFKKMHEQWKHGIDRKLKMHQCEEEGCTYSAPTLTAIKQHKMIHQEKLFTCDCCGMKIKTKKSLERHMKKVHLGIRPFLCQVCGSSFGDVFNLRSHLENRHGEKQFKCPHCSYECTNKSQYGVHLYCQHGVKAEDDKRKVLKCSYCDYTALNRSRLKTHTKKHTQERPFTCDVCGKSFTVSSSLIGHKSWHHSTVTHQCNQCTYVTKTSGRLKEHVVKQHMFPGFKPYKCFYCKFTCATNGNTRKHVMNKHPKMEVKYVKNEEMLNYMKKMQTEKGMDFISEPPEQLGFHSSAEDDSE